MSDDDERFLADTTLDATEWRGVGKLANAISVFEPLAKRGNLGEVVADRLVAMGLAEKDRSSDRYFAIGMKVGYRLSHLIQLALVDESPNTPFGADMHYRRTPEGESIHEAMWRANKIPK